MSTITLTPKLHIHQPQPQQSHRVTLFGVLWVKILRYIDQSTAATLLKGIRRLGMLLVVSALVVAPQFTFGVLTSAAKWHSYRLPIFCAVLCLTLNAKRIWLAVRRRSLRTRGANQHTYHGIPVAEFASFLLKHEGFKLEDAKKLALSRNKYDAISEELEQHGILVRGDNNARVLRPIGLEELVRQLRDKFPLMWDEVHQEWTDKEDPYGRWLRAEGFKTKRLTEDVEKKERKLERLDRQIGSRVAFARMMV